VNEEPNINKMVVEFVNQNIDRFYATGKEILKGTADKVRLYLFTTYKDYLSCVAGRYSKAKTFLIRGEAVGIYDFYVPTGISSGKKKYRQPSFADIANHNNFSVLTGGGGSGKSILMRHLFLSAISSEGKVPIFLELRDLNQTKLSILDFIQETLHENHFKLDATYIGKALQNGHFALFLDGFDELSRNVRKQYTKQIQKFAKLYDQNVVIVSSRPDDEFSGWSSFSVFTMDPLDIDQASLLVKKTHFEDTFKNKFIKDLRSHLFKSHQSFLSNPLLLSIMLLTYGESADIPNRLNIFYNQAYEALFQRHDALKSTFQRERVSKLNIQDFAAVFAAFSIQTYDKRLFQFSKSEALDYVEKSKSITKLRYNSEDYLTDAIQATCLLLEEGLSIVFAHRSFQEYFAARFIADANSEIQAKLIHKYSTSIREDSVLALLHEMKPEVVERILIIPTLERFEKQMELRDRVGPTHLLRFLKKNIISINWLKGGGAPYFTPVKDFPHPIVWFILERCGHLVEWKGYSKKDIDQMTDLEPAVMKEYKMSEFKLGHEMFRRLARGGGVLSIKTLQALVDIKKSLIARQEAAETSILKLLVS
jgi:hypothetical protein